MNSIKILKYFLDNREEKFTINQISKVLNINYRIAHTEIKKLEKEKIITTKRVGNSLLCSLTNNFNEKVYLAEHKRREEILKNKDLNQILKRYKKAKQSYILLLFGSYAKHTQTKHSDIDLLAITQNPKEIEGITNLIPVNIHLTTVTHQEFLDMKNSKELTVGSEVIRKNIILIGIENYYRLLQND